MYFTVPHHLLFPYMFSREDPMQYISIAIFKGYKLNHFHLKNCDKVSNLRSKHELWVLVGDGSMRRFTKTRPFNIQQYFTAVKMFIFR